MSRPPLPRHSVTQPLDPSYRLIPLTQGQNAIVDTEDFEWLSQWHWYAEWSSFTNSYYAGSKTTNNRRLRMHRAIIKTDDSHQVDHRNHNTLDNRRNNLRVCNHSQNAMNKRLRADSSSGLKGVRQASTKWAAQIRIGNKAVWLGTFSTPEKAARTYDSAARKHFGEFALTNYKY